MADRYWVGGAGNWSDNTNHWAASSGGSPNATKPTTGDNVFVDDSSDSGGSFTITLDEDTALLNDVSLADEDEILTIACNTHKFQHSGDLSMIDGIVTFTTGEWYCAGDADLDGSARTVTFGSKTKWKGTFLGELSLGYCSFHGGDDLTTKIFIITSDIQTFDIDAATIAGDCTWVFVSDADAALTVDPSFNLELAGTQAYRIYVYEAGRLSVAGDGVITDLGPDEGIDLTVTDMTMTYTHMFHMNDLPIAGDLSLTDSEFWFVVGTIPEEEIVSGTWTLVNSIIASHNCAVNRWYVKPTGTLSLTRSYLFGCHPTIYSSDFYIVFFEMPRSIKRTPAPKVQAVAGFLGASGDFQETLGYKSATCQVSGDVSFNDRALWNHPLEHLKFIADLEKLNADQAEIFKWTWHEGHWPKAAMTVPFTLITGVGGFKEASRTYDFIVAQRPYN